MSEQPILDMTATELRAMSRKLSTYAELHPEDEETRLMAERCGHIDASLEAQSLYQRLLMEIHARTLLKTEYSAWLPEPR